jgi:hypothetical protein
MTANKDVLTKQTQFGIIKADKEEFVNMENSSPENLEMDLVIVANDDWPARIARLVRLLLRRRNLHFGQILFCPSVYDAVVSTLELRRRDRVVKACIMVDYLPEREMNVFTTLAKLSRVSTIAFSGFSQRKKLIQAQQFGADDLLTPTGEANLKEPEAPATGHKENGNTKAPQPTTENTPAAGPDDNEPLLSREEIDSLLH